MKTYTIVAGVNGCGKSSLTGVLRTETDNLGRIIDVDKITMDCGFNAIEGGKKAIALIDECLEKEICFTQETTLSESLQRIENRVKKGGHNIDSDTVANRFEKRFDDLLMILPYCNEATFYDNYNGFVTVAKYKNGELQTIGQKRPDWLENLIKRIG